MCLSVGRNGWTEHGADGRGESVNVGSPWEKVAGAQRRLMISANAVADKAGWRKENDALFIFSGVKPETAELLRMLFL